MSKTLRGLAVAFALLGCATAWAAPPAEFQDEQALSAAELNQRFGFIYALLGPAEQLEAQPAPDETILARLEALEGARATLEAQNAALATRVQQLEAQLGYAGEMPPEPTVAARLNTLDGQVQPLDGLPAQVEGIDTQVGTLVQADNAQDSEIADLTRDVGALQSHLDFEDGQPALQIEVMDDARVAILRVGFGADSTHDSLPEALAFLQGQRIPPQVSTAILLGPGSHFLPETLNLGHQEGRQITIAGVGSQVDAAHTVIECEMEGVCLRLVNGDHAIVSGLRINTRQTASHAVQVKNGRTELTDVVITGFAVGVSVQGGGFVTLNGVEAIGRPPAGTVGLGLHVEAGQARVEGPGLQVSDFGVGILAADGGRVYNAARTSVQVSNANAAGADPTLNPAEIGAGIRATRGSSVVLSDATVQITDSRRGLEATHGSLVYTPSVVVQRTTQDCAAALFGSHLIIPSGTLESCGDEGVVVNHASSAAVESLTVGSTNQPLKALNSSSLFGNGVDIQQGANACAQQFPEQGDDDYSSFCVTTPP